MKFRYSLSGWLQAIGFTLGKSLTEADILPLNAFRDWLGPGLISVEDARVRARRRLPRLIFDFIDGATGREHGARINEEAIRQIRLQPRVLVNVENRTLGTKLLGRDHGLPFGVAPMGMCNLAWPGADRFLAGEAVRRDIPVCVSAAASASLEEMHERSHGRAWFQLYVGQSPDRAFDLVDRAANAGYETLILTVDVPQVSRRVRDIQNGFQVPFRIGPRQFLDFATHPRWSVSTLAGGIPRTANFDAPGGGKSFVRGESRGGADWLFLDRLRHRWQGRLVVKGVMSTKDALRIRDTGADAIYVSNHGGRQLDSAPPAIEALPRIRAAVGADYPLIVDSGFRNGEDIVKALALGADFVMLGRPILYALGADGGRGLSALIDILAEEISLTLAQIGLRQVTEISASVLAEGQLLPAGAGPDSDHRMDEIDDRRRKGV